jgi:hypothetical protein
LPQDKTLPIIANVELEPNKRLPKSKVHSMKRTENKQYEAKVDDQLLKGLKLHVVEVTPRGRIYVRGKCMG